MSLKIKKTVDLNLVVHQFVKTTKAHYRTMLKVSQNGNTIQHLSFLPSKAKTYHGQNEKYTTKKKNTQVIVFILKKPTNCSSSLRRRYFSFSTKNTFQSTRKVKTQKTIICSSWSKRKSLLNIFTFFFGKLPLQRLIWWMHVPQTCFSGTRISQNTLSWLSTNRKMLISVLTPKLNHSWFQKNRTKLIRLSQMFEPEHKNTIKCRCLFWID